ncbi:MAG: hypothetical protein J6S49_07990 [Erysipelotrichaceae bacterium]|nr:hypothetical protein [Erysipelotrichaceae bacterium]
MTIDKKTEILYSISRCFEDIKDLVTDLDLCQVTHTLSAEQRKFFMALLPMAEYGKEQVEKFMREKA